MYEQRSSKQPISSFMVHACTTFEENSWRKHLCTHCFRTRDEHNNNNNGIDNINNSVVMSTNGLASKSSKSYKSPFAPVYHGKKNDLNLVLNTKQETNIDTGEVITNGDESMLRSALKVEQKNRKNEKKVVISNGEVEIIGYGGEDNAFDDADFMNGLLNCLNDDDNNVLLSDEDKEFHILTIKNTEYNSEINNLLNGESLEYNNNTDLKDNNSALLTNGTSDDDHDSLAEYNLLTIEMDSRLSALSTDDEKRLSSGSDGDSLLAQILGQLSPENKELFGVDKKAENAKGTKPVEKISAAKATVVKAQSTSESLKKPVITTAITSKTASSTAKSTATTTVLNRNNWLSRTTTQTTSTHPVMSTTAATSSSNNIKSSVNFSNQKSANTIFSSKSGNFKSEPATETTAEVKTFSFMGETRKVVVQSKTVAQKENSSPVLTRKEANTATTTVTVATANAPTSSASPKPSTVTSKTNIRPAPTLPSQPPKIDKSENKSEKAKSGESPYSSRISISAFKRSERFKPSSAPNSTPSEEEGSKPVLRSYKSAQLTDSSLNQTTKPEPSKYTKEHVGSNCKTDEEKSALIDNKTSTSVLQPAKAAEITAPLDSKHEEVYYFKYDLSTGKGSTGRSAASVEAYGVSNITNKPPAEDVKSRMSGKSVPPPIPPPPEINKKHPTSPTRDRKVQSSFLHDIHAPHSSTTTANTVSVVSVSGADIKKDDPYKTVPLSIVSRPRHPSPPRSIQKHPISIPPHESSSPEDENYEPIDEDLENIYDAVDEKMMTSIHEIKEYEKANSPIYAEPNLYDTIANALNKDEEIIKPSQVAHLPGPNTLSKKDKKSPVLPPKNSTVMKTQVSDVTEKLNTEEKAPDVGVGSDMSKVHFAAENSSETNFVQDKDHFNRQRLYRRSTGAIEAAKVPDLSRNSPGRFSDNNLESCVISGLDLDKGKARSPPPPPSSSTSSDSLSGTSTNSKTKTASITHFSRLKSPPSPPAATDEVAVNHEVFNNFKGTDTLGRKKKFSLKKLMKFGNKDDTYKEPVKTTERRRKLDIVVIRNTEDGPQMIQDNSELEGATVESLDDIQRTLMATSPDRMKTMTGSLPAHMSLSRATAKGVRPPPPRRGRSQSEDRSSMRESGDASPVKDEASLTPSSASPASSSTGGKPDIPKRYSRPKSDYMNIGEARLTAAPPSKPIRHYTDMPTCTPPPPPSHYDRIGSKYKDKSSSHLYDPVSDSTSVSSARSSNFDEEYLTPINGGDHSVDSSLQQQQSDSAEQNNVTVISISDVTKDIERLIAKEDGLETRAPLASAEGDSPGEIKSATASTKADNLPRFGSVPSMGGDGANMNGKLSSSSSGILETKSESSEGPVPVPRSRRRRSRGGSSLYEEVEGLSAPYSGNYTKMVMQNLETLVMASEKTKHKDLSKTEIGSIGCQLRWKDFTLKSESPLLITKHYVFYSAFWKGNEEYTLILSSPVSNLMTKKDSGLQIFTQFEDTVPTRLLLPSGKVAEDSTSKILVAISHKMMLETLSKFSDNNREKHNKDAPSYEKLVCFILLQIVTLLKSLQAQGIEEIGANLDSFILVRLEGDTHQRLVYLEIDPQDEASKLSLCMCAIRTLYHLLHIRVMVKDLQAGKLPNIIQKSSLSRGLIKAVEVLSTEKANSLTHALGILEFMLWGPDDKVIQEPRSLDDQEPPNLRLWLELERARKVNHIARSTLTDAPMSGVYNEYHVHFLVRGTVKRLWESHNLLISS